MSKASLLFPLFVVMISPIAAYSEVPKDFIYLSLPIDSLCLFEATDTGQASLKNCGISAESGRSISSEKNTDLLNKDFIGYNYQWTIDKKIKSQGYSYYKILGKTNDSYIVYSINNSGGSGEFTAINLVKRSGDQLQIETIASGDRCNNGIYDVTQKDNKLIYHVNLTAFDFLTLANDNPHKIKAYDDLDSCAACCEAAGVFERELGSNFNKEKFLYVDLNAYPNQADNGKAPNTTTYQSCFDNLINMYKQKGKNKLNQADLEAFTHQFNRDCFKTNEISGKKN